MKAACCGGLPVIATRATPDNERNYAVEGSGKRSQFFGGLTPTAEWDALPPSALSPLSPLLPAGQESPPVHRLQKSPIWMKNQPAKGNGRTCIVVHKNISFGKESISLSSFSFLTTA
jgi:hypothetical protein